MADDRDEIRDLTVKLGLLADARDWDGLADLFTEPVEVDYASLTGGDRQTVAPADLVAGWRAVLGNLDATQHLIAGQHIVLERDSATCAANLLATHRLANATGGPLWTIGGRYDLSLIRTSAGWRIGALALTLQWATGNQQIMSLAAAAGQPASDDGKDDH